MPPRMSLPLPALLKPFKHYRNGRQLPKFRFIVYKVTLGSRIVYIGQTYRMRERVIEHGKPAKDQKGFDGWLNRYNRFLRVVWHVEWIKEFSGEEFLVTSLAHHAVVVGTWLFLLDRKERREIDKYGLNNLLNNKKGNDRGSVELYIRGIYDILKNKKMREKALQNYK